MWRLMPAVALPLLAVGGLCLLLAAPGYAEEAQAFPFAGEHEVRSAAADGIKFRVIYPDQGGMASVAVDIGALTPLEVWFSVDDKRVAATVIERSPGVYAAVLPTIGLIPGCIRSQYRQKTGKGARLRTQTCSALETSGCRRYSCRR